MKVKRLLWGFYGMTFLIGLLWTLLAGSLDGLFVASVLVLIVTGLIAVSPLKKILD